MRLTIIILVLLSYIGIGKLYSQDTIYVKTYSDVVSIDKKEAVFFKVLSKGPDYFRVDFFDIDGTIISTEYFSSSDNKIRQGDCIYFSNGKIYMKGKFNNDKMNGSWITYSNDGKNIEKEDNYLNSIKDGKCTVFYKNGKAQKSYDYSNGTIITTSCYDTLGNKLDCDSLYLSAFKEDTSGIIYDRTEVSPKFKGGTAQLMKFLSNNIKYPEEARKKNLEGKVVVKFIIDEKGFVKSPSILADGIGGGCAEEAMRVVLSMPKWTPGIYDNKFVKTFYTLPVSFKLQ